jgi:ferredoxin
MGVELEQGVRKAAFVKCSGDCNVAKEDYKYSGITDCRMAALVPNGGSKSCNYGCLGLGSCAKACDYDGITIVNGVAVIDRDKCKACGQCVAVCPKNLIEIRPVTVVANVVCSSKDKGKAVMDVCSVGCVGCTLCAKQCEVGAITMVDNIPVIDAEKCIGCGKCAEKCPKKIIHMS